MCNGQCVEPIASCAGAAPQDLEDLSGVEEGDRLLLHKVNGAPPESSQSVRAKPAPVLRTLAARSSSGGAWRLRRCRKAGLAMGVLGGG